MRDLELADGTWYPVNGVLRFFAALPQPPVDARNPDALLACPTCHARLGELCRTTTGRDRRAHQTRIVAHRCPCGNAAPHRKVCDDCRDTARARRSAAA